MRADNARSSNLKVRVLKHAAIAKLMTSLVLTKVLESAEPLDIVRAVRQLDHEDMERKIAEQREIAGYRSNARGAKARKELVAAEKRLEESTKLQVL